MSEIKKCGVCHRRYRIIKKILMVGKRGGIQIIQLCKEDYYEYGKKIGMDTLRSITFRRDC